LDAGDRLSGGPPTCRLLLAARPGAGAVQAGGRGQDVAAGGNSSNNRGGGWVSACPQKGKAATTSHLSAIL